MATGQNFGPIAVFLKEANRFTQRCCDGVFEVLRNHDAFLPFKIFQIFSGRARISIWVTPKGASASTMALITAGVEPMVPASPTPLTPIGFTGDGVIVRSSSNGGKS